MGTSACDRLLVAAIDLGTTYSGYAFQFRHDHERDPLKISTNTSWIAGGQGLVSWKTPTTVLFDPEKNFHSFGYEAEEKYTDLAETEEHTDWYYFRRFKMLLHGKLGFKRHIMVEDALGNQMEAKTVFAAAISFLRKHLLGVITQRGIVFTDDDVFWVLTVPAIWNEPAKQFMREAAIEGGIDSSQLRLALEPEAASVFCKIVPTERLDQSDRSELTPFKPYTKYMVLDMGGGTVDVTVHQVQPDFSLKEVHKASGGAWGGTTVDASYFSLFTKVFGETLMKEFMTEYKVDHLEMQRDFEQKKRNIKDANSRIPVRMSVALRDLIKDKLHEKAEDIIARSEYSNRVTLKRDRMIIAGSLIYEMFDGTIKSIVKHVSDILQYQNAKDVEIILLVGGFAESPLIQTEVTAAFPNLRVVVPEEPGLAVVKGAVLFGHMPHVISSRVSKFTYGVASMGDFEDGRHPEEKKVVMGERRFCRDLFSTFVGIGADIDEAQKMERIYTISNTEAPVVIEVFASPEEHPTFTTDTESKKLGEVHVKAPIGGWKKDAELKIEMELGGTEFRVTATELRTQVTHEATFDFLEE